MFCETLRREDYFSIFKYEKKRSDNFMKVICLFYTLLIALDSFSQIRDFTLKSDTSNIRPIGKLVYIGGYRLHINFTGKGKTTVVLVAGSLGFSFDWILVQEKLSKDIKVVHTIDLA